MMWLMKGCVRKRLGSLKDHKKPPESVNILQVKAEHVYYSISVAFRDTLMGGFIGFVVHLEQHGRQQG